MIKEPFYGLFLSSLNKVIDNSQPTLAVGLQGINPMLYINEKFWNGMTDLQQIAVLKHEMIHICFFHLTMRSSFKDKELFNIAADLEVNQLIENLPDGCMSLKMFADRGLKLPPHAGTKEYYDLIGEAEKNDPNLLSGIRGPKYYVLGNGNHDGWKDFDDLNDSEKKLVENQTDYVLKNTAQTIKKAQGTIPGELRNKIDSLFEIKKPVFNWKAYFRRVIGNSIFIYTKKSLRKLSKRFEDSAGIKIKQKQAVLVAIDTSGSIADDELKDFFSEIHHMYKAGARIDVIECDAKIGRIYEYKGKADFNITGGGGTDFAPVIEYYNEHRKDYTTLVYFTDGYARLDNFKLRKPMIWLISSNGAQDEKYPGLTIKIPKV